MAVEIYSYGNVDALHGIFNAVTMIFGGADFLDMVRTCIVAGFLAVMVYAALPGQSWRGWGWFISLTVVYSIMFVPRADVIITDKLGVQPPVVVSNVPWTLAFFASFKSVIGHTLTSMFETGFQTIPNPSRALPAELSYQNHGLMFGNRLIKSSRASNIIDPQLRADIINYNRNCVVPEFGHSIDPKTFQQSSNLWGSMATTNKALFTNYMKAGAYIVSACDVAYADLNGMLPAAVSEVRSQIAASMFPNLSPAAALAKIDGSLQAAYTKTQLASASASVSDILLQNMMLNVFADTQQFISVATADPAAVMLAATRANATAQMNMSYTTQGRMAEQALPIIRNATEGILFAVFPVICLLLVASEGQALGRIAKSYFYALLWVELWPVMFAVLNFIATTYSARNIAAMAFTGVGTPLSLDNAGAVYSTALSDVAVVGWMVTFVPALAGALLWGMDKIVSAVPGKEVGAAADKEANQTSKGNLSQGNLAFENQGLAPNRTDAFMRSDVSLEGKRDRNVLTGDGRDTYNSGTNPLSIRDTQQISQAAGIEQAKATQRSDTLNKQYGQEVGSAFGQTVALLKGAGVSNAKGLGVDLSKMGSDGTTEQDALSVATDVAKKIGVTDVASVAKVLRGSVGLEGLGTGVSLSGSNSDQENVNAAVEEGRKALKQRGIDHQRQVVENFRTSDDFKAVRSSNREATDKIDASFSKATQFREGSDAALAESKRYNEVMRRAELVSRDTTFDYTKPFNDYLRSKQLSLTTDRTLLTTAAQEFLMSGEVYSIDGQDRFMPQNGGGPNIMQNVSESLGGVSPESLRTDYGLANPGGGTEGVMLDAMGRAQAVAQAQRREGLNPNTVVTDGGLRAAVNHKQAEAQAAVDATREATGEGLYALREGFDDRVNEVDALQPFDKPAIPAVRFGRSDPIEGEVKPPDPPGFPPGYVPGSASMQIPTK